MSEVSSHPIPYCDVEQEVGEIKLHLKSIDDMISKRFNHRLTCIEEIALATNSTVNNNFELFSKELLDQRKMIQELRMQVLTRLSTIEKRLPQRKLQKKIEKSCMPIIGCFLGN